MISKNIKPSIWVEQVTSKIEHGGTLIDIACGEGRHSTLLCKNFFVYAVDKNNDYLKKCFKNIEDKKTIKFIYPPKFMMNDNAAMIAWATILKHRNNHDLNFKPNPRLTI